VFNSFLFNAIRQRTGAPAQRTGVQAIFGAFDQYDAFGQYLIALGEYRKGRFKPS